MAADENVHPLVAQVQNDIRQAFEGVMEQKLSQDQFLASFPPSSTTVHRESLLRFRENLITLARRGFQVALDDYVSANELETKLRPVDEAGRDLSALGTVRGSLPESLAPIGENHPDDILRQARIEAKRAEVANLQREVDECEKATETAREELQKIAAEYTSKSGTVRSFIQSAVEVSQNLSVQPTRPT